MEFIKQLKINIIVVINQIKNIAKNKIIRISSKLAKIKIKCSVTLIRGIGSSQI